MQVLTEEEITAIGVGAKKYARAVEAAVLEKPRQQEPEVTVGAKAPPNNLPAWDECALRVANSDFIAKRVAEGGYGPEPDSKLATQLHRFIYEYDDIDPYRSAWFLHRLELVLEEVKQEARSAVHAAGTVADDVVQDAERYRWLRDNWEDGVNIYAATVPAAVPDGWKPLTDVQWMNIVNANYAWATWDKEDAIAEVAKLVEDKLKENNYA